MQNNISNMTNEAGPVMQTSNEFELMPDQVCHQTHSPQDDLAPSESYDFEPIPVDSLPDWFVLHDDDSVMDEFAKMLKEMEDASASVASNVSETSVDDEVGSDIAPVLHTQAPIAQKTCTRSNPFTAEICKSDLIRCFETAPTDELDSLDFFAMEYVRAVRFLKVRARWYYMPTQYWIREVTLLLTAVARPDSDLKLWRPLAQLLGQYNANVAKVHRQERRVFRRAFLARMTEVGKLQVEANKAAVDELLTARKISCRAGSYAAAKKAVGEDCGSRGSLLLGTIPEFLDDNFIKFSKRWSWVD